MSKTPKLTRQQWAVMHAIELGELDVEEINDDLATLERLGFAECVAGTWRPTEEGRTLVALRRQISVR